MFFSDIVKNSSWKLQNQNMLSKLRSIFSDSIWSRQWLQKFHLHFIRCFYVSTVSTAWFRSGLPMWIWPLLFLPQTNRGLWSSGLFIRAPCPRAFLSLRNICCGSVLSPGIIAFNLLKCSLSQNFHFYKFWIPFYCLFLFLYFSRQNFLE